MDIINLTVIEKKADIVELDSVEKFNPYHGKDGRFTSGTGGGSGSVSGGAGKMSVDEIWKKSKGEKLFSYNGQRCHAAIVPGLKKENLPNQKKHSYVGTMDGYEIYDISPGAMMDQFGFAAIKKGVEKNLLELDIVEKYNPYHDSKGRFTSAGGAKSFSVGS
ncbi:MAG: hypothetical protein IIV02_08155, partial [Peptococcaceae bacterium]|nr:hypothetical protein [Peptococcaceae bacterium]